MKKYKEFYIKADEYDGEHTIYVDITDLAANVFGENIVKMVCVEVDTIWDVFKDSVYKKYIDKNYSMLKEKAYKSIEGNSINIDAKKVIVEFIIGNKILVSSSEWGDIKRLDD